SVPLASIVSVAPNWRAQSNFLASRSTAMILAAPARRAPITEAAPTPPQPITATESPRPTWPVLIAAPIPAITPHPNRPTAAGSASATLVHWPAATNVLSANAQIPNDGANSVPSSNFIFWLALCVAKQYQGRPRRHARHSPH